MFGLGFTEILLIAIVALLFIGPDKLPETLRNIAKTFGKIKRALDDTKSTIEQELRVDDLRQEVMMYKQELERAKSDLSEFKNIANKEINEIKQNAQIEDNFKASSLEDDKELDKLFEEAEADFKEIEQEIEQSEFKNINETKELDNIQKIDDKLSGFKNIKEDK